MSNLKLDDLGTMYLLVTDETNLRPSTRAKFFLYGGVILPLESLPEISQRIAQIRAQAGYGPTDTFKFDTNSRPGSVSPKDATAAKRRALGLCSEFRCHLIVYAILHAIAKGGNDQLVLWGADHVIGRFHQFLTLEDQDGICMVDNLPVSSQKDYLCSKFSKGLTLDGSEKTVDLPRIRLFGATYLNAAHVNSLVDIAIGSFRYCINEPPNLDAAREMMTATAKILWNEQNPDGSIEVLERGLILRPKTVRSTHYKDEYDSLLRRIGELLRP